VDKLPARNKLRCRHALCTGLSPLFTFSTVAKVPGWRMLPEKIAVFFHRVPLVGQIAGSQWLLAALERK
jgi:hypothetical protein